MDHADASAEVEADRNPGWRRFSSSLTARILWLVSTSTVLTALLVTSVSLHSIHGFLHGQLNARFPAALDRTAERLSVWYTQVRLDVDTFARSETLASGLARLSENTRGRRADRAREEIRQYFGYVLERFDPVDGLFVLDLDGRMLLGSGPEPELDEQQLRRLSAVVAARVGEIERVGDRRRQIASAPIGKPGERVGSLHAVLDLGMLDDLVQAAAPEQGEIFLIDRDGAALTSTPTRGVGDLHARPYPNTSDPVEAEAYTDPTGREVVGATRRFERFPWAIVIEQPYQATFQPITRAIWRVALVNLAIVAIFGAVALRIAVRMVQPIKALSSGVSRLAAGDTDVSIDDPGGEDEVALLTRTFNDMIGRLHAHQRALEDKNEELEALAVTDGLTGLYNHRYFQRQLIVEVKRAQRSRQRLALLLVDIDDFKQLNDTHGHATGDAVLRAVARSMQAHVRETDTLARYGGEEFALLSLQSNVAGARAVGEKLRGAVAIQEVEVPGGDRSVRVSTTVSIGVAFYDGDPDACFAMADRALYAAKERGKDCVVVAGETGVEPAEP